MQKKKSTVLLVDDTKINIVIMSDLLKNEYDIKVALNGQSALDIVKRVDVDLVLLDIMMPDINGYEVCETLKKDEQTKHIPVIFITANSEEDSIEKAYDVGGTDYITKPFKAKELLARVKKELDLVQLITDIKDAKQKITDSIKFSSLIQDALLPKSEIIGEYFSDFFVLWEPKDIVGGDIYQFIEREDDCLVFVIDCTGHGVPGAFMTMVTKTVIQSIVNDNNFNNPALIMQELSKNIKTTLKQDNPNSKSDAGLDGGILYFNKKENRAIYSGAKTPLFYIQDEELKVFKSDRQSVGYKKSDTEFKFSNFELNIEEDTHFYITTDGFIDQNGGDEGYPLGKKKLQKLILENYKKSFQEQKDIFHKYLLEYQGEHERDDDVTFLGFVLKK